MSTAAAPRPPRRAARWLWVVPAAGYATVAALDPPTLTWVTGLAAAFAVAVSALVFARRRPSAGEVARQTVLDLDELVVVPLALVADPVLVGAVYGGARLAMPGQRPYRQAYTVFMRALLGTGVAALAQLVPFDEAASEPGRYLLLVLAATVAHVGATVGSLFGVWFAVWVESRRGPSSWTLMSTPELVVMTLSIPLGALGADLLLRAPWGALLLGVVVVAASVVGARLLSAELAVRDEQARREELLNHLAELADAERRELVREIHDGPLQHLILTRMMFDDASDGDRPVPPATLAELEAGLVESVRSLRAALSGSGSTLVIDGLGPAVAALVAATRVPDAVRVVVDDDLPPGFGASGATSAGAAAVALACARELFHNALKHARATTIRIETELAEPASAIVVRVVDDGAGFDPDTVLPERRRAGHLGIALIRERLEQIDGHLDVASRPGAGTRVTCAVPLTG